MPDLSVPQQIPAEVVEQLQALEQSGHLNKRDVCEVEIALLRRFSHHAICHNPMSAQQNAPQLPLRGA